MGRTACTEPQCLYSRTIFLLPLWAVRPLQNLIACTVELYLYYPYGPYGLYRPSVPVQYSYTSTPSNVRTACTEPQCLYSTAIPVLLLMTVRPVQSLSTSTRVWFTFTCIVSVYIFSYWHAKNKHPSSFLQAKPRVPQLRDTKYIFIYDLADHHVFGW